MSLLKRIRAWLTQFAPEEAEGILRAEEVLLEARLTRIQEELAEANRRQAYAIAKRLVTELREKRGTPLTDSEKKFLKTFAPKEACRHLKGGRMVFLGPNGRPAWDKYAGHGVDYSVSDHVFPDGSRVIRCTICGDKWTKDSPDWKEALEMSKLSSNMPSSSEITISTMNAVIHRSKKCGNEETDDT